MTLRIARWLENEGMDSTVAAAVLKHQMLLSLDLHIGSVAVRIRVRSVGGLTGSRVAGAMGRVLVEEVMAFRSASVMKLC